MKLLNRLEPMSKLELEEKEEEKALRMYLLIPMFKPFFFLSTNN